MSPVPAFPCATDAMAMVRAGLRFLAAADATQMPVQTQASASTHQRAGNWSRRCSPARWPSSWPGRTWLITGPA